MVPKTDTNINSVFMEGGKFELVFHAFLILCLIWFFYIQGRDSPQADGCCAVDPGGAGRSHRAGSRVLLGQDYVLFKITKK